MKKVLAALPNYSKYCAKAKAYLEENGCEVIENTTGGPLSQEQLKELVSDIDGAVAGVEVWNEEILSAAPKLKVLARFGVGVDNYDLEAAKRHGVVCTNCPGVNAVSVAEHAVMLMLNLLSALLDTLGEKRAARAAEQAAGVCQMLLMLCAAALTLGMILLGASMAAGRALLG